ncbi:putative ABC transporter permease subunit [Undibacterium sp. Rencai35W]|uniref:putative ABC transporter permease subunit n=1 Tax=Undibacterium sp. Rencai35W TaxID=3413046 RepID=UPI003BF21C58
MAGLLQLKEGSAAWLLAHEIRLFFYDMGESKSGKRRKRGMSLMSKLLIIAMFLLVHTVVWLVMRKMPVLSTEPPAMIMMGAGAALFVIFTFMLSFGLNRSVRALFERGDLDLLLSSPLASETIFTVRLTGIVIGVAMLFLLILTPIAHVGLILGQPRYLGVYPVIVSMALIASSLSMMLTLSLVRWLGVRRTLVAAQLLGAATGASIFLIIQLMNHLDIAWRQKVFAQIQPLLEPGRLLSEQSVVWLPAHALFGSPWAVLVMAGFGFACFKLTTYLTHDFFVRGVQQAGGVSAASVTAHARNGGKRKGAQHQFKSGLWRTVVVKEWRMILRDPQLISQVLLQLLYLMPMFFIAYKNGTVLPATAAMVIFIGASLAGSLIWVMVSAEDAPDLLMSAPGSQRTIRNAKVTAAVIPLLILIAPFLLWLGVQAPLNGLMLTIAAFAAMTNIAMLNLWLAKPGSRAQFNKRGQGNWLASVLEAFSAMSWAATVYFSMQYGWIGLIPLVAVLLLLGFAWLMRIERNSQ